MTIIDGDGPMH